MYKLLSVLLLYYFIYIFIYIYAAATSSYVWKFTNSREELNVQYAVKIVSDGYPLFTNHLNRALTNTKSPLQN